MAQVELSFLRLVKKTTTLAKSLRNKRMDPLTLAKQKVLAAMNLQKVYALDLAAGKRLPRRGGDRPVTTWFSKQLDGWYTDIRYGQTTIPIGEKGETDMLVSENLEGVAAFYDAVAVAIQNGELDAKIGVLRAERSAALRKGRPALRVVRDVAETGSDSWQETKWADNTSRSRSNNTNS